ncbi:hypothetical protein CUJ83_04380 [Methanocella sp. CWC-04]|uniref:Uncharacterized protein n=1 Tax=Methanooceanicella nereidis TaxID=2052831 RepID=A0AAP2RBW4_9EURY|nr:hypothetical protein [Methanocella sp. CWC-04]MCD1294232.1 hypothetical protein [Methanocella sp. CWC-04]
MRVKILLVLAIASLVLMSAGNAFAADTYVDAVADDGLVYALSDNNRVGNSLKAPTLSGFPILGLEDCIGIDSVDSMDGIGLNAGDIAAMEGIGIDSVTDFDCGTICAGCDCEECPDCDCEFKVKDIQGPIFNLGCPTVLTETEPVNLVSPDINPVFPIVNIAPKATVTLPEVTAKLTCFDISCDCGCPFYDNCDC